MRLKKQLFYNPNKQAEKYLPLNQLSFSVKSSNLFLSKGTASSIQKSVLIYPLDIPSWLYFSKNNFLPGTKLSPVNLVEASLSKFSN